MVKWVRWGRGGGGRWVGEGERGGGEGGEGGGGVHRGGGGARGCKGRTAVPRGARGARGRRRASSTCRRETRSASDSCFSPLRSSFLCRCTKERRCRPRRTSLRLTIPIAKRAANAGPLEWKAALGLCKLRIPHAA